VDEPWYCYMLRCGDGSLYVGITNDLEDRLREHNRGKDSVYTAKRRPVTLVWSEPHPTKRAARRREMEIKGWSRRKKAGLLLQTTAEKV
jgi:predicted GIY-YIG superfamily endonuclease